MGINIYLVRGNLREFDPPVGAFSSKERAEEFIGSYIEWREKTMPRASHFDTTSKWIAASKDWGYQMPRKYKNMTTSAYITEVELIE